jgi:hypothetical protein
LGLFCSGCWTSQRWGHWAMKCGFNW